ncbi:hypothetical protein Tco_0421073 [Tanacetum coccineum]
MEVTATIDGRVKTITEASIRMHLKLEDSDGISTLHNTEIFKQLALIGFPPYTNVADEAASIGVDVRHGGVATAVTSLDAGKWRRCAALETDVRQTKKVYDDAFTTLIKKVKKLEKTVKTSQARRRSRVVISDDNEELEDPSKQGRSMIEEIDQDTRITLLEKRKEVVNVQSYTRRKRAVSTGSGEISTAEEPVSTAGASMPFSTASIVQEASTPLSIATKDTGKAIMQESESPKKLKQRKQIQISRDKEVALKLQEEFDAAERQRIARVYEEASSFNIEEWEDIQATIKADEELA